MTWILGVRPTDGHIKLSLGLKNNLPSSVRIRKEVNESSEDIALIRTIHQAKVEKEEILLFDRGISKADTYNEPSQANKYFIILPITLITKNWLPWQR